MAENNSNVTIFAILILAVLAVGVAFFYLRGNGGEDAQPATVTEPAATEEQPALEPDSEEDQDSDFSLEFEDEEGNKTTIQGDGSDE